MEESTNCLFRSVGHHVCENTGEPDVRKNAPYPSSRNNAFLSDGYYFWEDNEPLAKDWGGKTYLIKGKSYFVCQFSITCNQDEFYDLVGNRSHQRHLLSIRKFLTQRRQNLHGWPIGKIIDFLREANRSNDPEYESFKGQFEYAAIRAVDVEYKFAKVQYKFSKELPNFTDLNPCYIICVIALNKVVLGPIEIVYTSKIS